MGASWERERASARDTIDRLLPRPYGVGNDYAFLAAALAQFDGERPRVRASVIVSVYNDHPDRILVHFDLDALARRGRDPRRLLASMLQNAQNLSNPENLQNL